MKHITFPTKPTFFTVCHTENIQTLTSFVEEHFDYFDLFKKCKACNFTQAMTPIGRKTLGF